MRRYQQHFLWPEPVTKAVKKAFKKAFKKAVKKAFKKLLKNAVKPTKSASVAGARDEGREEGFEKGLQEGLEKGLEEGLQKGRKAYKVAINQCETENVCDKTGLTLEEVEELRRDFSPGHRPPDPKRFRLAGQGPDDKPMDYRIAQ